MAHFIKLTPIYPPDCSIDQNEYVNIDHIDYFYATSFGTYISVGSISADRVKETPDQILALIAEAQGVK